MADCHPHRPLAIVTAAACGLGLEVARCCALQGFDLLLAAADAALEPAAAPLRRHGVTVQTLQADLAAADGADALASALGSRPVRLVVANAGHGLDRALDHPPGGAGKVDPDPFVKAHLKGIVELIQRLDRNLRAAPQGHVLLLGSMRAQAAGPCQALCHGTRRFLEGFAEALRQDFEGSRLTVSCCLPAGPTPARNLVLVADAQDPTASVAQAALEAALRMPATAWRNVASLRRAAAA